MSMRYTTTRDMERMPTYPHTPPHLPYLSFDSVECLVSSGFKPESSGTASRMGGELG